jgi:hypothetical protein
VSETAAGASILYTNECLLAQRPEPSLTTLSAYASAVCAGGAWPQVLQWPNGVPVTSGCGAPVALNNEGLPITGPGGLPCCLGPDGDTLLTWEGKALLGPQVSVSCLLGLPKVSGLRVSAG